MDEIILYFGSLLVFALIELVLLVLITMWTPAWTFIEAALKKERLILHVGEDKYLRIKGTKSIGSMSEIKKQGFYITSPKDTYIEAKSKSPIAICYGKYSLSLTPKAAAIAKHLEKLGLQNYEDIQMYYSMVKAQRKRLTGYIEKGKDGADIIHPAEKIPANEMLPDTFNILGESVNMEDVIKYFSSTERSDIIEAEIQRRTAAQAANQFKQGGELIKWAAVIMIIMIGGAIAYAILSPYIAGAGGGTTIINNFMNGTTPTTIPSIVSNTSLNVTPPAGVVVT